MRAARAFQLANRLGHSFQPRFPPQAKRSAVHSNCVRFLCSNSGPKMKVGIVGSGPAGFYTARTLLKKFPGRLRRQGVRCRMTGADLSHDQALKWTCWKCCQHLTVTLAMSAHSYLQTLPASTFQLVPAAPAAAFAPSPLRPASSTHPPLSVTSVC
eukprot:3086464-Rhodomonas_salina.2